MSVLPYTSGFAHEAVTVGASAIGFTAATIVGARGAFVSVETASIRFTVDGTTPTSTVGHLLNAGDNLELTSADQLTKFRAIRTGSSGTIMCTFFK